MNDNIADMDHESVSMIDNPMDKKTVRDLMWENRGPGVLTTDYHCQNDLKNDEWKFDEIPQIIVRKNIAIYYAPDIEENWAALEEEKQHLLDEMEAYN